MSYTILRPSCFMEFWLSPTGGFDFPNRKATLYGDGKSPTSWVSFVDVARSAVMDVDSPAVRNTILELGGPDKVSANHAVKIFEERSGKPFQVEYVPVEALQGQRTSAEDPLQQSFAALMLAYAQGDLIDMDETLQRFPVTLTSVQEYAKRMITIAT